jgi:ketosteroid isomerase-like protein
MRNVENSGRTDIPKIVSSAEWLSARKELLAKEKELTRHRDAVNAERRRLPMVRIEKDHIFDGHYAPDIVAFDLALPLQYRGAGTYRKNWEEWFPTFRGPIGYEIRDLSIAANEDLAFCHSFNRITGTRTDDEKTDVWVRATVCCRKLDGQWKIVLNRYLFTWTAATERRLT